MDSSLNIFGERSNISTILVNTVTSDIYICSWFHHQELWRCQFFNSDWRTHEFYHSGYYKSILFWKAVEHFWKPAMAEHQAENISSFQMDKINHVILSEKMNISIIMKTESEYRWSYSLNSTYTIRCKNIWNKQLQEISVYFNFICWFHFEEIGEKGCVILCQEVLSSFVLGACLCCELQRWMHR